MKKCDANNNYLEFLFKNRENIFQMIESEIKHLIRRLNVKLKKGLRYIKLHMI